MDYVLRRPRLGVLPFLRWAGSKRQLLPRLASYWNHSYKRYLEPFAGSARLFFHLCPKSAILGDINQELIHTYEQLIRAPDDVISRVFSWRQNKSAYYKIRSLIPETLDKSSRAARFIYLNRYCFNGLYRTNLRGDFNVPYGGLKTGRITDPAALRKCSRI